MGATLLAGASSPKESSTCGNSTGIALPPGFCATVFADDLGNVRHVVVGSDGTVYANSWNGSAYFRRSAPDPEGFLIALPDKDKDGKADRIVRFGLTPAQGSRGGTGIGLYKNSVYAEMNDQIVRYEIGSGGIPSSKPQVILSGMPVDGDHPMHPFAIDSRGRMYVDMGSATNACQTQNRRAGVAGASPCKELETRAGIWMYSADKLNQTFSPKERFATGIRNGMGLSFDAAGRLYSTSHGRDQLLQNWSRLYPDARSGTELPAEELLLVTKGGHYGWPYCYYDGFQKKRVLAPEYGGDGGAAVGNCATYPLPVATYPAHWAPNDLKIYNGPAFPAAYRGGAFIAFHGSWNRAPGPQNGFAVVFQPIRNGTASGQWTIFADGFAGPGKASGQATYRPTGLAVGPEGALYISDDRRGRIWKVTYRGPADAPVVAAAAPQNTGVANGPGDPAGLPTPPGFSASQVARGMMVYQTTTCAGCHGQDASGAQVGPTLATGSPIWTDGSLAQIADVIAKGVPQPRQYAVPMPAMGGAALSHDDLAAVAAYVWAVGHGSNQAKSSK